MIFKPNDYEKAASYDSDFSALPAGAYVCEVKNVAFGKTSSGKPIMNVSLDIAEGEYTGYFMKRYKHSKENNGTAKWGCVYSCFPTNPDGSTTNPHYKGFFSALEKSNNMLVNWSGDEKQFAGKLVGILFRDKEFIGNDGTVHRTVEPCASRTVDAVRAGECKTPKPKLLDDSNQKAGSEEFTQVAVNDDELPF